MKKKKKELLFALTVLGCVCLTSCGLSPENAPRVSYILESETDSEVQEDVGQTDGLWNLREHLSDESVALSGYQSSDDYPYGYNVGAITDEVVGDAILITPGTSVAFEGSFGGQNYLNFEYILHPWVAEKSDGVTLSISVEGNGCSDDYAFNVKDSFQNESISLEQYLGDKVRIVFSLQNETGRNDECDWVALKNVAVDRMPQNFERFGENGYVRSATYFSNEWPVNFWNSELDNLDQELRQIHSDGFDSIILVIPWREFQPEMAPIVYNDYAFANLDRIMQAAENNSLDVYARIGYTWDYYHDKEGYVLDRFDGILSEENVQNAWYSYVDKMHRALSAYPCFRQAFLTWEDFWYTLHMCDENEERTRQEMAASIGYQSWVEDHFELSEYNEAYGSDYVAFTDIPVPRRTEPAMAAMYAFYDDFLMSLLETSQRYFPNLSMEVRMDWDQVYRPDGTMESYKHTKTFGCGRSDYTATMYGIPMGFENIGERVGYQEAMDKTASILQQLKQQNGNKAIYIEQFIFADNTPGFEHNAQIKDDELIAYLENVAPVLLENSEGYGIWTYRNYCSNMLYNPQFALEGSGWDTKGDVAFERNNGSMACFLAQNSVIGQTVPNTRISSGSDEYVVVFDIVDVKQAGELIVSLGGNEETVEVSESGKVCLVMPRMSSFDLKIKAADCVVGIDNVKLYAHIQQGFLYDENNNELLCIDGIRKMNAQLSE